MSKQLPPFSFFQLETLLENLSKHSADEEGFRLRKIDEDRYNLCGLRPIISQFIDGMPFGVTMFDLIMGSVSPCYSPFNGYEVGKVRVEQGTSRNGSFERLELKTSTPITIKGEKLMPFLIEISRDSRKREKRYDQTRTSLFCPRELFALNEQIPTEWFGKW